MSPCSNSIASPIAFGRHVKLWWTGPDPFQAYLDIPIRTEGRNRTLSSIVFAGQVFQGTVPLRPEARRVVIRIIRIQRDRVQLKVTAMPHEHPIARGRSRFWVLLTELETMIATKLAEPVRKIVCPSCTGTMQLYDAVVGKKTSVTFACTTCEECFEI